MWPNSLFSMPFGDQINHYPKGTQTLVTVPCQWSPLLNLKKLSPCMIISVTAMLKKFNIVKTSQRRKVCRIALKEACKNLQSTSLLKMQ